MQIGQFKEYKGYIGSIEYSVEDSIHYGKLSNIEDLVNYEAGNITDLEKEFHKAVDDYIKFKTEARKEIEEEYKKNVASIKIKKIATQSFDEWCNRRGVPKYIVGKHEVEISLFFKYYVAFANFPIERIEWFNTDRKEEMNPEDYLEALKMWYTDVCNKVNKGFEEHVRLSYFADVDGR